MKKITAETVNKLFIKMSVQSIDGTEVITKTHCSIRHFRGLMRLLEYYSEYSTSDVLADEHEDSDEAIGIFRQLFSNVEEPLILTEVNEETWANMDTENFTKKENRILTHSLQSKRM